MTIVPFQSTLWTVISRAGQGDRDSFERFVGSYRRPLVSFLQAKGLPEADAEDLSQEVFLRIYEKRLLLRFDAARGRFRSFLLAIARNMLSEHRRNAGALKREGGRVKISLEDLGEIPDESDPDFDRLWVENLLQVAFEGLKSMEGEGPSCEVLRAYTEETVTYGELAARHGISEAQVRDLIHAARKKLKKRVQDLIADYVLSREELEEEKAFLSKYLR